MITINGTLKQVGGSADSAATITFELKGFGQWLPTVPGTGMIAETKLTASIMAGAFSVQLYGNDTITPTGTFYLVTLVNDEGAILGQVPYQFTGAGSLDLSSLTPLLTVPTDISPLKALDLNSFLIQIRRGSYSAMPALADGEVYFCVDSFQIFAGNAGVNVAMTGYGGGGDLPTFVYGEVPSGTVNGSNKIFTLAQATNPADSLCVFLNGVRQITGVSYSLNGTTITFTSAPVPGDTILVDYSY